MPEILGAGIGGGLGGAAGVGLGAAGKFAGVADTWTFTWANQFLSGISGFVGTEIGWSHGEQGGGGDQGPGGAPGEPCNDTSGHKDRSNGCH